MEPKAGEIDITAMNVLDAIAAGRYENNAPYIYRKEPVDEDTMTVRQAREHKELQEQRHREQRKLNQLEYSRLRDLFKADLENEHGVVGHPKADRLFEMAWEDGHSGGYEPVAHRYAELVELVRS